jgi:5-methylcytosine-specific restriction enzyme subunit McrC
VKAQQSKTYLTLNEYEPKRFSDEAIPNELLKKLHFDFGNKVSVDFASPKTDDMIQLTSLGWVGYIPLSSDLVIKLQPKVKLHNLFRMLEYAYDLKNFQILEGLIECNSLNEFYERLANILSLQVLNRSRKGFYRTYLPQEEKLPYVRGKLNIRKAIQKPFSVKLHCHYEDHTADVQENQIIAWSLFNIARSGFCTEKTIPNVRRAYRSLRGLVSIKPFRPNECLGICYNRLNNDYQMIHALCRFFLEHIGPGHEFGDNKMLPFMVNMNHLYERFVAKWLEEHLPPNYSLKIQEKVDIGEEHALTFKIDLVLYDANKEKTYCVLDTKYKAAESPDHTDIAQAIAYAEMK